MNGLSAVANYSHSTLLSFSLKYLLLLLHHTFVDSSFSSRKFSKFEIARHPISSVSKIPFPGEKETKEKREKSFFPIYPLPSLRIKQSRAVSSTIEIRNRAATRKWAERRTNVDQRGGEKERRKRKKVDSKRRANSQSGEKVFLERAKSRHRHVDRKKCR